MRKIFILPIFLFTSFISGEINQIILKDYVYTRKDSITINDLVGRETDAKGSVSVLTNCFFSNAEIHGLMDRGGAGDLVLIGAGTYVIRLDTLSSVDEINQYISGALKGQFVVKFFKKFDLPEKFKVLKISNEVSSNILTLIIDYVFFRGDTGFATNEVFDIGLERPSDPEPAKLPENNTEKNDSQYIENLDMGNADLVFSKGNISIKMKVRIIRKLEDSTCLVENNRSGRVFKVKIKEPL